MLLKVVFSFGTALLLVMSSSTANGQSVRPDSETAAALLDVRSGTGQRDAAMILMRSKGQHSKGAIEALADSLMSIAMRGSSSARMRAIATFAFSGKGPKAERYERAGERLLAIAESTPEIPHRAMAIHSLTELPDDASTIQSLKGVASSNNRVAHNALTELWTTMAERGGRKAVRELFDQNKVKEPTAVEQLESISRREGWKK